MTLLRTPLKAVRGIGAAKEGVAHWWAQRLSAVALIPLSLWFVASLFRLFRAERFELVEWLSNPIDATLMVLLLGFTFWHAQLGVKVIIEDYVHGECRKQALLMANQLLAVALGAVCIVSVLFLALGG